MLTPEPIVTLPSKRQFTSIKLSVPALSVPQQLRSYAVNRWQRNAKVQMRAQRNGDIFHASGVTRVARDAAMWALGGRLLDQPWLYGYGLRTTLSGK